MISTLSPSYIVYIGLLIIKRVKLKKSPRQLMQCSRLCMTWGKGCDVVGPPHSKCSCKMKHYLCYSNLSSLFHTMLLSWVCLQVCTIVNSWILMMSDHVRSNYRLIWHNVSQRKKIVIPTVSYSKPTDVTYQGAQMVLVIIVSFLTNFAPVWQLSLS